MKQKTNPIQWLGATYLRGALAILALYLIAEVAKQVFAELAPFIASVLEFLHVSPSAGIGVFVVLPLIAGFLANLVFRLYRERRGIRAFHQIESRLSTELKNEESGGYRVGLISWPSAENRTIGIITSTFCEPGTERELASVYIPGAPNPGSGSIKIIALENIRILEWDLKDLTTFQFTYGAANPG